MLEWWTEVNGTEEPAGGIAVVVKPSMRISLGVKDPPIMVFGLLLLILLEREGNL